MSTTLFNISHVDTDNIVRSWPKVINKLLNHLMTVD